MEKRKRLIIMVGCPGSGKSYLIRKSLGISRGSGKSFYKTISGLATVVSRDEIRFSKIDKKEDYFKYENEVVKQYKETIRKKMKVGFPIIFADATHMNKRSRKPLIDIAKENGYEVEVWVMGTPLSRCITNNRQRNGLEFVPPSAIKRLYGSYEEPTLSEGINLIRLVK